MFASRLGALLLLALALGPPCWAGESLAEFYETHSSCRGVNRYANLWFYGNSFYSNRWASYVAYNAAVFINGNDLSVGTNWGENRYFHLNIANRVTITSNLDYVPRKGSDRSVSYCGESLDENCEEGIQAIRKILDQATRRPYRYREVTDYLVLDCAKAITDHAFRIVRRGGPNAL
jgi:hypothetical protein